MRYFLLLLLITTGPGLAAQNFDSACVQQQLVLRNLKAYHYSPPEFNKATNAEILDLFIRQADERAILVLGPDKSALTAIVERGETDELYCLLLKQAHKSIRYRITQIDSILARFEATPLEFSAKDTLYFIASKKDRWLCATPADLARRIEKRMKYECLLDIVSPRKDSFDVFKLKPAELATLKDNARKRSLKRLRHFLADLKNDNQLVHHLADCMSNAIANRCDPHSNFLNNRQMESFNNALSTEETSFGFLANEDADGNLVIGELAPGGPAWKSNDLNENDVILSFRFEGEKEVDLDNTDLDDFYELFYRSAAKEVQLRVRKKDFKIKTVTLKKEKILSQENLLNSYVLRQGGRKMGYVPIPSFYSDRENDSRQGCANDVAKEIVKLKQDSIEGLILDLRYNGGGSMREAMGLAGIFIDEGPVAIYRPRSGKPFLLKDLNRGSIWDGPLLILVNSGSASASEFVTATLQDYNRAVVAGSSTFGKGSAQNVLLTDSSFLRSRHPRNEAPAYGFMKITEAKFYRLSAESHQGKGIRPDIYIPGLIEKVMEKEADYPFFLACDSVNKKVTYNRLPALPLEELQKLSAARTAASTQFREISLAGDSLHTARSQDEKVLLTLKDLKTYNDRQKAFNARLEAMFSIRGGSLSVSNNSQNQKLISLNEYQRKNSENSIETLKKDLILQESVYILNDLINHTHR